MEFIGSLRWFGNNDRITLEQIRQGGAREVVTALHEKPIGAVWEKEEITALLERIRAAGLDWTVVESLPVHEDIKKRKTRKGAVDRKLHCQPSESGCLWHPGDLLQFHALARLGANRPSLSGSRGKGCPCL